MGVDSWDYSPQCFLDVNLKTISGHVLFKIFDRRTLDLETYKITKSKDYALGPI